MTNNKPHIQRATLEKLIAECNLQEIFISHLNWDDAPNLGADVAVNFAEENHPFHFDVVAQKRDFAVCFVQCESMPNKSIRQKLERRVMRHHYEHLLVLRDSAGRQMWMVAIKKSDKPIRFVEVDARQPQLVVDKLLGLVFTLDDEEGLVITDVVERTYGQFLQNTEKVTRGFYDKFRKQLEKFASFIEGITDLISREQYSSLMLNRLMFIYFIQKKGYLDGEKNYLQDRLQKVQEKYGKDNFQNFYRLFLRELFRQLGEKEAAVPPDMDKLIGKVPYLNGGLFDEHQIEKENEINISDKQFKEIFDFFDQYQWYLDDRREACEGEINPDVMGYIFEKYINDRAQMGAYYTKEDITNYISRNTILPVLLQKVKVQCKEAFDSKNGTIWKLLREKPDNYIYEAARKGCEITDDKLPENIRRGLVDADNSDLLELRANWNENADNEFALLDEKDESTETWRECIARRKRYVKLKEKMQSDDGITDIADLVTYNLDIERLTANTISQHEGADFISAMYYAIAGRQKVEGTNIKERRGLTILDPACGSGAFLFSALNILQPLYDGCIMRMEQFVKEDNDLLKRGVRSKERYAEYRAIWDEIKKHPKKEYWIYRNIILHNLFGVDIMPDAAEVAKLRLFLKLAAVSKVDYSKDDMGLEPLPDIDFNIRAGNSLVGFSSMAEFKIKASEKLGLEKKLIDEIEGEALAAGAAYDWFVEEQSDSNNNDSSLKISKEKLRGIFENLNKKLNSYLTLIDGIDCGATRPLHWFAEFYGIIEKCKGFDVVIGNPPYVEVRTVPYKLVNYASAAGNLYAFMIEKSVQTLNPKGGFGMIVPISLPSTKRMKDLREMLRERFSFLYAANFADRPGTLFSGVHQKVTIAIGHAGAKGGFYTTNYLHWSNRKERPNLFKNLHYQLNDIASDRWGKFGDEVESEIWGRLQRSTKNLLFYKNPSDKRGVFYLNMRLMFWVKSFLASKASREFLPFGVYDFPREAAVAMLNSSVFFWFWETIGDGWHLTNYELDKFKFGVRDEDAQTLADLGTKLEADLEEKKRYVGTVQTEYEYVHARSKSIIDEIDKILAKHYGFTKEELDYIINYDYKYRMSGAD